MATHFTYQDARLKKTPVRVRVYVRNGTHPDGVLVKDHVLRPLTKEQRKNGEPDLLAEYASTFGRVSAPRYVERNREKPFDALAWRDVWDDCYGDIPEEVQLDIWNRMRPYYWSIAKLMSGDGVVSKEDEESLVHLMHSYVVDHVWRFDQSKSKDEGQDDSFEKFCKQQARDFRGKFIEWKYAAKRGGGAIHVSIVGAFKGDETPDERRGRISEEVVGAVNSFLASDEDVFLRDVNEYFTNHLTKRERIALKELYDGMTQEYVADLFGLTLTKFRREILGFIQLVVDFEFPAEAHRYHMDEFGPRKFILK